MGKRARRKGVDTPEEPPDTKEQGEETKDARRPGGLYDPRMREVIAYAEEADMLYHLFRWTLLKGSVPTARDWLPREDMPHPDAVVDIFGSWPKFLEYAGLPDSPLLARLRAL